jgi:hypothetical protein
VKPNAILVKVSVNSKWEERFRGVGVLVKTPDEATLELKHMFHALSVNQNPYGVRPQTADSGTPVFGKEGATDVSLVGLFQGLRDQGYIPGGIHIRTRGEKKLNVLVIPFIFQGEQDVATPAMALSEEFISASWGFIHVWVNPPQEDGRVIHTVNVSHRSLEVSSKSLRYQKGEWVLE